MYKHCSAGPLECIFMAQLTLFNEGVLSHFVYSMELKKEIKIRNKLLTLRMTKV